MKKLFFVFATMLIVSNALAYSFEVDGIYYNVISTTDSTGTIEVTFGNYPFSNSYSGDVVLPSFVKYNSVTYSIVNIGDRAFNNCINLKKIIIPSSITSIGYKAFNYCTNLTSITIPSSVTYIGNYVFSNCHNLTTVNLPSTINFIGDYSFENCQKLSSITLPESLTYLGQNSFYRCVRLNSIILPESLTYIGQSAFYDCSGLTSLNLPSSIYHIGNSAFSGCSGISGEIVIPSTMTYLSDGIFNNCLNINAISIPSSVTSIGSSAFEGCYKISGNLFFSDSLITIGNNAFKDCSELDSLTISSSITSIGSQAFYGCSGLEVVTIPKFDIKIDNNAFNDVKIKCTTLTPPSASISSFSNAIVFVPAGALEIYKTAWGTSSNVIILDQDVDVDVNVTEPGTLATTIYNQTAIHPSLITKLIVTGVLNENDFIYIRENMKQCYDINLEGVDLNIIPNDAFSGRSNIYSVKLPTNLSIIGNNAFKNCFNITEIVFPETLSRIGEFAFYQCNKIRKIDFPVNMNFVGKSAFYYCTNLTDIVFNGNVKIDVEYSGQTNAFSYCTKLTNLVFKGSVSIGDAYIYEEYYRGAFENCINLKSIIFSSDCSIGAKAFKSCTSLTNIQINNANYIGHGAFFGCNKLENVKITGSTSIGISAFGDCTSLKTANIDRLTAIGKNAFSNCTSLDYFIIPQTVTEVGECAFCNCVKMDSIIIGGYVESIGTQAFAGCSNLSKIIVYKLTPPSLGNNVFNGVDTKKCKLIIFDDADFNAYFSAAQWGNFLSVERISLNGQMGDSNEDGAINIIDVVNVVNYILEKPVSKFNMLYSDINKDGSINVIDVVQLVKLITSAPTNVQLMRIKNNDSKNGIYKVMTGTFQAYFPTGLRGFDIEFNGKIEPTILLEGFNLLPYTRNGKQHLLGYTTGDALFTNEIETIFELTQGTKITEMTFVSDNGSPVNMILETLSEVNKLNENNEFTIDNGIIRLSENVYSAELFDSNGSLISNSTKNQLILPKLIIGVYIIRLNTDKGIVSRKIVL